MSTVNCSNPGVSTDQQLTEKKSPFMFGLASTVNRQKQLLFSEYRSDVVFRVGNAEELIHAHKLILTIASKVFYAQFNGSYAESNQDSCEIPVKIEDIKPAAFREVLRYIYCEEISLTAANILGIYYASQKYELTGLSDVCEKFINTSVVEINVLEVFDANQQYGFSNVNDRCLQIIQDNPIQCFESKDFLKVSEKTLHLIAGMQEINCDRDQLCEAIDKWCKANESTAFFEPKIKNMKCRKLYSFSEFQYQSTADTRLCLNVQKPFHLYGLGVIVGINSLILATKPISEEWVSITVTVEPYHVTATKKVALREDLFVQDIVFKKLKIYPSCTINVTITGSNTISKFFCFNDFKPIDTLGNVYLSVTSQECKSGSSSNINNEVLVPDNNALTLSRRIARQNANVQKFTFGSVEPPKKANCVAYLLYNVEKKIDILNTLNGQFFEAYKKTASKNLLNPESDPL
ncbi:uncharacterized protein LOC134215298 [Armigeres subalbatus]|uniref:uncharacterized protein LOC134215298 n=1 Tax=Armigeres subalbatus TaxID=124917 RepID=UPI002ED66164